MHDRWKSYEAYACAQSVCAAHLVRELTFLAEQEQPAWAADRNELLLAMHAATQEWRAAAAGFPPPPAPQGVPPIPHLPPRATPPPPPPHAPLPPPLPP